MAWIRWRETLKGQRLANLQWGDDLGEVHWGDRDPRGLDFPGVCCASISRLDLIWSGECLHAVVRESTHDPRPPATTRTETQT